MIDQTDRSYFVSTSDSKHICLALYGEVTSAGEELHNFGLCSALRTLEQEGIFIVSHMQRHGTLLFCGGRIEQLNIIQYSE
jgi:hypothetical protein